MNTSTFSLRAPRMNSSFMWLAFAALALVLMALNAGAATNTGTALQGAYTALDDMINGYGKQLLTVVGFAVAAIGFIAANATSVIMKFVGYAIFLGVGLAGAVTIVGAVI